MIYIIGGASRSGKSIAAKKFAYIHSIPYFSIDWLMMGLKHGAPSLQVDDNLLPDEIARKLWPTLYSMIECMIHQRVDYILEGEAIMPELLKKLTEKYPLEISSVFLGYEPVSIEDKVNEVIRYSAIANDWISDKSYEYITEHVINMAKHSQIIKKKCLINNMAYIDTTEEFSDKIKQLCNQLK
ncbi:hypothetical protein ATG66_0584 [Vibrio sp. ES.051]|uniref:hypothetical protein n=1 Tax=Vibrio sp. ES.051 TaxID=1761909 RepID=UPI000BF6EDF4|nr:hypothetical protein [Vibrio sp. ES.051]PFG58056.1 hypothetical protein ATG66_0584 [Vibrio sp. ES.051]